MDIPELSIPQGVDSATLAELRVHVPGYRLTGILGRGGQATVYKAIDFADGQTVAIKVLHGGPLADAAARARFEREIIAIKALNHPHIVTHRASGQTPGGHDYLVMNFIDGERLDDYLWNPQAHKRPGLESQLRLFVKICRAVGEAHRAGITHRDLSPSNIRVDTADEPHIVDFGMARTAFDGFFAGRNKPVTATHQFIGKLAYASPEQVGGEGAVIDIRSDVYSLGVILYQILADGRLPYDVSCSLAELLNNILSRIPEPLVVTGLRDEQDTLSHDACRIAFRALQKRPDDRQESANALAMELQQCLSSRLRPSDSRRSLLRFEWACAAVLLAIPLALFLIRSHLSRPLNQFTATMPAGSNIDATKPSSDQQLPSVPLTAHTTTLAADFPLSGDRARKIQRDYAVATGLPMTTFLNIDALNSIQFALIPPGRFLTSSTNESSSSAQPSQHRITISHAIYLATTPITVAQFSAFIKQTNFRTKAEQTGAAFTLINNAWHVTPGASWREPGFDQSPDDPVVEITWPDAVAFCEWISITSGRHVRLPTSAEWEYACRSGTATRFYVGDSWAELEKAAWCLPNSLERTHPVAQKIPNAWGLYDMHGNASQWCQDWFGAAPSADAVDPTGPATGDQRIKRGGSWLDNFVGTSSSSVACNHPNTADSVEGFRILLEVPSFAGSH